MLLCRNAHAKSDKTSAHHGELIEAQHVVDNTMTALALKLLAHDARSTTAEELSVFNTTNHTVRSLLNFVSAADCKS